MDDDYDNYSGEEEFNEDALTNDEYDALYAAMPKVKAELATYNSSIEDIDIKESLYYNYFEEAAAIAELKSKFPKKKDDPPKLSKLAMLAKSRAGPQTVSKLGAGAGSADAQTPKIPLNLFKSPENSSESGKLKGLAAFAKARAAKSESTENDTSAAPSSGAPAKPRPLGFGALGNFKVNSPSQNEGKIALSRGVNGAGVELRRKLENAKRAQQVGAQSQGQSQKSEFAGSESMEVDSGEAEQVNEPPASLKRSAHDPPQLSFELSVDQSGIYPGPQKRVSALLFSDEKENLHSQDPEITKRRRLSNQLFSAYTNREPNIAKAKSNFSSPSPDDKVLDAQKRAFEQSVQDLSLKEAKNEKLEEKSEAKAPKTVATKPFKKINVQEELSQNPNFTKPSESFVIIGHVDAGKSTLMGRMLYDLGAVDAKTVNKLVREAEKSGKGSFALAWVMDQTAEERSRGVTIDICATTFETAHTRFTAIDAPGHKDFVPQMIGGVSQADIALLVIDSITGEFEAGFLMDGQTKEHAIIARNLGIKNICVAVNKLDKENWSESRFQDIKEQLGEFLASDEIGFQKECIAFVPISGLTGCNVVKNELKESALAWYKGPTLVEYLETVGGKARAPAESIETLFDSEFNLAISDIYDVTSSEFKVKGKISRGMVQPGESVVVHPTEDCIQVQAVAFNNGPVNVSVEGQIVSLTFKVNSLKNKNVDELAMGDIVSSVKSAVSSAKEFRAEISTFNMSKPLLVGTPIVLFRNNASRAARITKVLKTNGVKKKKMHLVSRQQAEVVIEILEDRRLPVSRFEDNKALGRVVIRREGITVGAGVITKVE